MHEDIADQDTAAFIETIVDETIKVRNLASSLKTTKQLPREKNYIRFLSSFFNLDLSATLPLLPRTGLAGIFRNVSSLS
jgi:hypothetical protein